MGAIAGILLVIVFLVVSFSFIKRKDDDVYDTKKKLEYLQEHSKQFKTIAAKENIDVWAASEDKYGDYGKRLREIISEIEKSPEAQKEIQQSLDFKKNNQIRITELALRTNYLAFQSIDLLKEIKKYSSKLTENDIKILINKLYPNENTEIRFNNLLANGIIQKGKNNNFSLGLISQFIKHPYELSENGEPKTVEI